MEQDIVYFMERAREESAAALKAVHPNARQSHRALATAYERRARDLLAAKRRLRIHVVSAG